MRCLIPEKQNIFLRASLSDICNFSCQYCAKDLGMENHTPKCLNAPLLTVHEYIHNLQLLSQHGFNMVSFTGGEPMLNPQFGEIVKECRPLFDVMEVTTNGTFLLDNLEVVKEYIDVLKISIDAYDDELAVKIANSEQARNTKSIIETCCRIGVKTIGFNFVYMKQNENELAKLVQFAHDLKEKYGTDIYISILDLYYSSGNREFWEEQYVDCAVIRERIRRKGIQLNRRLRVGCDSYNFIWDNVLINMKDSMSCTHRADICECCTEYCQEGIYSLKHSASGWISVCPTNAIDKGTLLDGKLEDEVSHEMIDRYIDILNEIHRVDCTGETFICKNKL